MDQAAVRTRQAGPMVVSCRCGIPTFVRVDRLSFCGCCDWLINADAAESGFRFIRCQTRLGSRWRDAERPRFWRLRRWLWW